MSRLRGRLAGRLARWLVGPFVRLPADDGVWVVIRYEGWLSTIQADRFRLKSTTNLRSLDYANDSSFEYRPSGTFTRFVGTVK
jgi:hypothetical protein